MISNARHHAASAYRRVHAETSVNDASPHQLVSLLFDGLLGHIAGARGALRRGDIAGKGHALGMAVRIVEEGLRPGLDRSGHNPLAASLDTLYHCITARLTLANHKNDEAMLAECVGLIEPVKQAWVSIGPFCPQTHSGADRLAA